MSTNGCPKLDPHEASAVSGDDSSDRLLIGVDLGATFAKLGLVTSDGAVVKRVSAALTDWSAEGVVRLLLRTADGLLREASKTWADVGAIGIGSPGHIKDGTVVAASNFPTWKNVPLAEALSAATGKPTALVNDADAAVSGEVWVGAAGGRQHAAMLTLGSGVGLGLVVNGKVYSGSRGLVEGGHMIVQLNGRACGCGQKGCLETYASANSVAARAAEALSRSDEPSCLRSVAPAGGGGGRGSLTAKQVFEASQAGDALACRIVDETADYLAMGCVNICRVADPEVIIFAGGMAEAGEQLLGRVRSAFQRLGWTILKNEVEMVVASLGPDAGLVGAAACARFLVKPRP